MGGCPLPLIVGLGAAIEHYQQRGPAAEFRRNVELRNRFWDMLGGLKGITRLGPPPGPQATALLGFKLPEGIDAAKTRSSLLARYKINIRAVDVKQWNGLRASLHVYNDGAQVERFVSAMEAALA
jgi:selenocysteine lyase/cysteine desulfurase